MANQAFTGGSGRTRARLKRRCVVAIVKGGLSVAATVGFLGLAALAFTAGARDAWAGMALGIASTYPASVAVGDSAVPVSLEIWNASRFPQDTGNVTLSSIKHTPSCGDAASSVCIGASIDPSVFTLSASGTGGSNAACTGGHSPFACCTGSGTGTCEACNGLIFTIAVSDVTTGEVLFTPSATVNLGPSGSSADTCAIEFTVDISELPMQDACSDPGLQTAQLARATGFHAATGTSASTSGWGLTTVLAAGMPTMTPTLTPTPTPTPENSGFVAPDPDTLNCEEQVAKNVSKLKTCIGRCQVKAAAAVFKERAFDEEACMRADPAKSCRAKYDAKQARLLAGGTCPPCLDATHQTTLADQVETDLDAGNGAFYCAGTVPLPP